MQRRVVRCMLGGNVRRQDLREVVPGGVAGYPLSSPTALATMPSTGPPDVHVRLRSLRIQGDWLIGKPMAACTTWRSRSQAVGESFRMSDLAIGTVPTS